MGWVPQGDKAPVETATSVVCREGGTCSVSRDKRPFWHPVCLAVLYVNRLYAVIPVVQE